MKSWFASITGLTFLLCSASLPAQDSDLERGRAVYNHWCLPCHGDGPTYPGTTALRAKYNGQVEPVLAERAGMTPDFVKLYVRNGISVMPHFRKTEIGDSDLDALAAYLSRH